MLVLTRKPNARILLDIPPSDRTRTIEVCVVEIRNQRVRLGFVADEDVDIAREELRASQ